MVQLIRSYRIEVCWLLLLAALMLLTPRTASSLDDPPIILSCFPGLDDPSCDYDGGNCQCR